MAAGLRLAPPALGLWGETGRRGPTHPWPRGEVGEPRPPIQRPTARQGFAGEPLAHQIEAGADLFLMPSLYEPCGLNQMYSMRYGTVPVVRATGGLDDTVQSFDAATGSGNGFKFGPYSAAAMLEKIREGLYFYNQPETWKQIQVNGMTTDHSWSAAARKYIELYEQIATTARSSSRRKAESEGVFNE